MRKTAAVKSLVTPVTSPAAKPKSLAQAHSDFTSEGSPLPGLVAAGMQPVKKTAKTPKNNGGKTNA